MQELTLILTGLFYVVWGWKKAESAHGQYLQNY